MDDVDALDGGDRLGVLDAGARLDHADEEGRVIDGAGRLRGRHRRKIEERHRPRQGAPADRRELRGAGGATRLLGAVDVGHDDAGRADVEIERQVRIVAAAHAHDRRDAAAMRRLRNLADGLGREGGMLRVDEEKIVAGGGGDPGDLDGAGDAHDEAERKFVRLHPPLRGIDEPRRCAGRRHEAPPAGPRRPCGRTTASAALRSSPRRTSRCCRRRAERRCRHCRTHRRRRVASATTWSKAAAADCRARRLGLEDVEARAHADCRCARASYSAVSSRTSPRAVLIEDRAVLHPRERLGVDDVRGSRRRTERCRLTMSLCARSRREETGFAPSARCDLGVGATRVAIEDRDIEAAQLSREHATDVAEADEAHRLAPRSGSSVSRISRLRATCPHASPASM